MVIILSFPTVTSNEVAHSVSQTAAETIPQLHQCKGEAKRELSVTIEPERGNVESKAAASYQGSCFSFDHAGFIACKVEFQKSMCLILILIMVKKYPAHIPFFYYVHIQLHCCTVYVGIAISEYR